MILKRLLNKSEWGETDIINFLLEASASSARFGVIKEKEEGGYWKTRANLHVMLVLPFGTGKTSSFLDVKDAVYNYDVTFPGVIGTINQDGEVVESAVIKAGGKVLIIDEFQRLGDDVKNALNSILEYPHTYARTLGYKIKTTVNRRGRYFRIRAKANGNKFEVYSKFSCIAGGMYVSKKSTISKAWFSRFIPIRFTPSLEYYERLSRGEKVVKINPTTKDTDFIFRDYLEFNKWYWNKLKQSQYVDYFLRFPNERGYLVRLLQDLVRLGAIVAYVNGRKVIKTEDVEFVTNRLLNFILASYITSDRDEIDMYILANLDRQSISEIAEKWGVTTSAISQRVKSLKQAGLIK